MDWFCDMRKCSLKRYACLYASVGRLACDEQHHWGLQRTIGRRMRGQYELLSARIVTYAYPDTYKELGSTTGNERVSSGDQRSTY